MTLRARTHTNIVSFASEFQSFVGESFRWIQGSCPIIGKGPRAWNVGFLSLSFFHRSYKFEVNDKAVSVIRKHYHHITNNGITQRFIYARLVQGRIRLGKCIFPNFFFYLQFLSEVILPTERRMKLDYNNPVITRAHPDFLHALPFSLKKVPTKTEEERLLLKDACF